MLTLRPGVRLRVTPFQFPGDAVQILVGLRDAHAWLQTAQPCEAHMIVALQDVPGLAEVAHGREHLRLPGELHLRGHHADDLVGDPLNHELRADHLGVRVEPATPERFADQHGLRTAGGVFLLAEIPSQRGPYPQKGQVVRRDGRTAHTLGWRAEGSRKRNVEAVPAHHRQVRAGVLRRAPIEVVGIADGTRANGRHPFAQHDESGEVWVRQRAEQHGVDHAENRGVRPDAERQHGDRDAGEAGRFY